MLNLATYPETSERFLCEMAAFAEALNIDVASRDDEPDANERCMNAQVCIHAIMFWTAALEAGGGGFFEHERELFDALCAWRDRQRGCYSDASTLGWLPDTSASPA